MHSTANVAATKPPSSSSSRTPQLNLVSSSRRSYNNNRPSSKSGHSTGMTRFGDTRTNSPHSARSVRYGGGTVTVAAGAGTSTCDTKRTAQGSVLRSSYPVSSQIKEKKEEDQDDEEEAGSSSEKKAAKELRAKLQEQCEFLRSTIDPISVYASFEKDIIDELEQSCIGMIERNEALLARVEEKRSSNRSLERDLRQKIEKLQKKISKVEGDRKELVCFRLCVGKLVDKERKAQNEVVEKARAIKFEEEEEISKFQNQITFMYGKQLQVSRDFLSAETREAEIDRLMKANEFLSDEKSRLKKLLAEERAKIGPAIEEISIGKEKVESGGARLRTHIACTRRKLQEKKDLVDSAQAELENLESKNEAATEELEEIKTLYAQKESEALSGWTPRPKFIEPLYSETVAPHVQACGLKLIEVQPPPQQLQQLHRIGMETSGTMTPSSNLFGWTGGGGGRESGSEAGGVSSRSNVIDIKYASKVSGRHSQDNIGGGGGGGPISLTPTPALSPRKPRPLTAEKVSDGLGEGGGNSVQAHSFGLTPQSPSSLRLAPPLPTSSVQELSLGRPTLSVADSKKIFAVKGTNELALAFKKKLASQIQQIKRLQDEVIRWRRVFYPIAVPTLRALSPWPTLLVAPEKRDQLTALLHPTSTSSGGGNNAVLGNFLSSNTGNKTEVKARSPVTNSLHVASAFTTATAAAKFSRKSMGGGSPAVSPVTPTTSSFPSTAVSQHARSAISTPWFGMSNLLLPPTEKMAPNRWAHIPPKGLYYDDLPSLGLTSFAAGRHRSHMPYENHSLPFLRFECEEQGALSALGTKLRSAAAKTMSALAIKNSSIVGDATQKSEEGSEKNVADERRGGEKSNALDNIPLELTMNFGEHKMDSPEKNNSNNKKNGGEQFPDDQHPHTAIMSSFLQSILCTNSAMGLGRSVSFNAKSATFPRYLTPMKIDREWSVLHTEQKCIALLKALGSLTPVSVQIVEDHVAMSFAKETEKNSKSLSFWSEKKAEEPLTAAKAIEGIYAEQFRKAAAHATLRETDLTQLVVQCHQYAAQSPICEAVLLIANARLPFDIFDQTLKVMLRITASWNVPHSSNTGAAAAAASTAAATAVSSLSGAALAQALESGGGELTAGVSPIKSAFATIAKEYYSTLRLGQLEVLQARFALSEDLAHQNGNVRASALYDIFGDLSEPKRGVFFRVVLHHLTLYHNHLCKLLENTVLSGAVESDLFPSRLFVTESHLRKSIDQIQWPASLPPQEDYHLDFAPCEPPRYNNFTGGKAYVDALVAGHTRYYGADLFAGRGGGGPDSTFSTLSTTWGDRKSSLSEAFSATMHIRTLRRRTSSVSSETLRRARRKTSLLEEATTGGTTSGNEHNSPSPADRKFSAFSSRDSGGDSGSEERSKKQHHRGQIGARNGKKKKNKNLPQKRKNQSPRAEKSEDKTKPHHDEEQKKVEKSEADFSTPDTPTLQLLGIGSRGDLLPLRRTTLEGVSEDLEKVRSHCGEKNCSNKDTTESEVTHENHATSEQKTARDPSPRGGEKGRDKKRKPGSNEGQLPQRKNSLHQSMSQKRKVRPSPPHNSSQVNARNNQQDSTPNRGRRASSTSGGGGWKGGRDFSNRKDLIDVKELLRTLRFVPVR